MDTRCHGHENAKYMIHARPPRTRIHLSEHPSNWPGNCIRLVINHRSSDPSVDPVRCARIRDKMNANTSMIELRWFPVGQFAQSFQLFICGMIPFRVRIDSAPSSSLSSAGIMTATVAANLQAGSADSPDLLRPLPSWAFHQSHGENARPPHPLHQF